MCMELAGAKRRGAGFGPSWNVLRSHGWNEILCIFFSVWPLPPLLPRQRSTFLFCFVFSFLTIDVAECRVEEVKKGSAVDAEEINLH